MTTTPQDQAAAEALEQALRRAFTLGQNYWADADSESYRANKRADGHRQKFEALVQDTLAALASTPSPAVSAEPASMWDRFITRLNAAQPLGGDKQHANFLGSVESYKRIFLEANASRSSISPSSTLRSLAAHPSPAVSAEPVAWGQLGMLNGHSYLRQPYDRTPYPPPADVIRNLNLVPLYTHPAPTPPAEPSKVEAMANQCDGCCAGMTLDNGLHRDRHGHAVMACQRDRYIRPAPTPPSKVEALSDFHAGQWWVAELDKVFVAPINEPLTITPDMKRAVTVVHDLLRKVAALHPQPKQGESE